MAHSTCISEDMNMQFACQLAAHERGEQLLLTPNTFVI